MLGLILIYWIGKTFYKLAGQHDRSEWGYAILGIAAYYGGQIVFAVLAVLSLSLDESDLEGGGELAISLIAIVVGALICWGLYKYLEKQWTKPALPDPAFDDVLDSDFLD